MIYVFPSLLKSRLNHLSQIYRSQRYRLLTPMEHNTTIIMKMMLAYIAPSG